MAYEVVMSYHLHMPSYFLGTFTEYPIVMFLSRIFDFAGLKKDYCLVFFQVVLQSLISTDCLPLKAFKCTDLYG